MTQKNTDAQPEAFFTLKQASTLLNLKYWALQRAAQKNLIPTYKFFNNRRLVRLSEIIAYIEVHKT
jgi:hypothetical protein